MAFIRQIWSILTGIIYNYIILYITEVSLSHDHLNGTNNGQIGEIILKTLSFASHLTNLVDVANSA